MEHITADSNKTILRDRIVWYDGDITVSSNTVADWLTNNKELKGIYVDTINSQIEQYNKFVPKEQQITRKQTVRDVNLNWNIPKEYANLDVKEHIIERLHQECEHNNYNVGKIIDYEASVRIHRVAQEIKLFEQYNMIDILRVLIYIINTLHQKNIVWGVGRGSSVSSYVLYLIGVHDVDSVQYGLDIHDFLRGE